MESVSDRVSHTRRMKFFTLGLFGCMKGVKCKVREGNFNFWWATPISHAMIGFKVIAATHLHGD